MLNELFGRKKTTKKENLFGLESSDQTDFDIFWLQRELEFKHQHDKIQFRTNENQPIKFGELINSLFDIRKEELSVLSINDGSLTTIEGNDDIWNYEFLKHYKRNENGEYSYYREGCCKLDNQIVLTLSYKTYDKLDSDKDQSISKKDSILIVHLQYPEGLKYKTFYIQTTFCLPTVMLERGKKGMNPQPQSLSILIGFDYRNYEETEKEFNTIFNSAKDKLQSNKTSELNYLERELMDVLYHPQIAKEFFFGKKVITENRFWDAIVYFNNAFKALQQKWWDDTLSDEELKIFIECSFLIGYCYYELGLFDKSFKYLEFSEKNSNGYKYQSEYINCLIALKDIRSLMLIEHHLEKLNYKKEDETTEYDYEFFMFLLRRKAYCMIELKQYAEANNILNHILKNDPDNVFAKQELEYIKQLLNN